MSNAFSLEPSVLAVSPGLSRSNFTENFLRINLIPPETFCHWQFQSGMKFQDKKTWWQDRSRRKNPHEGVDFQAYSNCHGNSISLDGSFRIPAPLNGTVAQIFDDFLGKSIHIIHDNLREDGAVLNSLSGHILPVEGLKSGSVIEEGEEIASIAVSKAVVVPPHLHLTTFWSHGQNQAEKINWSTIHDSEIAELFNPMTIIDQQIQVS